MPRGHWRMPARAGERDDVAGLLIVKGMLCREVSLRDRSMLELLGPGDVLQPPVQTGRPGLGGTVELTAVSDMILVVLGESFIRAAARWPSMLATVQRRLEAQRESLAIQGLIAHLPRAEHRLLLMLWHLAERWGYVTPDGIVLPLALTHDLLGQLIAIAAQRRPWRSERSSPTACSGGRRTGHGCSWPPASAGSTRSRARQTPSRCSAKGSRSASG